LDHEYSNAIVELLEAQEDEEEEEGHDHDEEHHGKIKAKDIRKPL